MVARLAAHLDLTAAKRFTGFAQSAHKKAGPSGGTVVQVFQDILGFHHGQGFFPAFLHHGPLCLLVAWVGVCSMTRWGA